MSDGEDGYVEEFYPVIVGGDEYSNDDMLHCPICKRGHGALHQIGAEVYVRSEEDSEDGIHVSAVQWHDEGRVNRDMCGNPSPRRDGIRIFFECECRAHAQLEIFQHKGATLVRWEAAGVAKKPTSYVYFIEAVGLGRIKIGVSEEPEKRLRQLATGSPVRLRLMKVIPGTAETEKRLHKHFGHLRFDREWFHGTAELLHYIKNADFIEV